MLFFLAWLFVVPLALAAPLVVPRDNNAQPTNLTDAQISPLIVPAKFARAAYCSTASLQNLSCGEACSSLGNVQVVQAGGNDGAIPRFFIAADKGNQQMVVSHQGTNPHNILSLANDFELGKAPLNKTVFPNQPDGITVHDGFQKTFERTADDVMTQIQQGLKANNFHKVMVVGHSLGAAVAVMDAMMLRTKLPASVQMTTTVFGLPRSGNQQWADFVDKTIGQNFTHVTNNQDPVPIVPPHSLDFQQPSNEVHILPGNATIACPGQENQNCQAGHSILDANFDDHRGPYLKEAFAMGNGSCPGFEDDVASGTFASL